MNKSERIQKSERARERRHTTKKIVEERTQNLYEKLKRERIKRKKEIFTKFLLYFKYL